MRPPVGPFAEASRGVNRSARRVRWVGLRAGEIRALKSAEGELSILDDPCEEKEIGSNGRSLALTPMNDLG